MDPFARKVLGHDPGTDFGISVLGGDGYSYSSSQTLRCEGPSRLLELSDYLIGYLAVEKPSLYVLEDYAYGARKFSAGVHTVGELGGVVRMVCAIFDVPLLTVAPTALLKFAIGKGANAGDKSQTALAVYKKWNVTCHTSHAAESYALARIGLNILFPEIDRLSQPQKEVVDGLRERVVRSPRTAGIPKRRKFEFHIAKAVDAYFAKRG